ncbi:MAG: uracil-DNA glycosylase [Candidatus Omnitrophica bacterium]|nr:uracil-DNA glycosylase [Candidatus Omnitrophota bacterium]
MLKADLHLKDTATHLVFGEGSPDAKIFFVGEAPGRNEDLKGLPFIGSAGKILDQLLFSIDLKREDVFITSILKYRPPKNRNPKLEEIISHTPFLVEQIKIIQPKVIVPLGNFAARFILGGFNIENMKDVANISSLHGKIEQISFEHLTFSVVALYHPAAILYNPPLKETLKKDFQVIRRLQ